MSAGEHNSFCWPPEAGGKKRTQSTRRLRKGNGYPMQWICDNAKKSWNGHLLNPIMRVRGKMGEKPREKF